MLLNLLNNFRAKRCCSASSIVSPTFLRATSRLMKFLFCYLCSSYRREGAAIAIVLPVLSCFSWELVEGWKTIKFREHIGAATNSKRGFKIYERTFFIDHFYFNFVDLMTTASTEAENSCQQIFEQFLKSAHLNSQMIGGDERIHVKVGLVQGFSLFSELKYQFNEEFSLT